MVKGIYLHHVFPDMKVTWGTHPNNIGHEDSVGCFRCHDGSHSSADGRTGTPFYFERLEVEPDVLILGEALGGGLFPIAVTMLTPRVNEFMNDHPMIHLSTFGGSDIACCVARAALDIYRREQPWKNAASMEFELRAAFGALARDYPGLLLGVQGAGLLLAMKTPSAETARKLADACLNRGLLVAPGKVAKDTVMVRPSLLITRDEADELAAALRLALGDCAAGA